MRIYLTILICLICGISISQPTIKVEVSADTVALGELVEITYTIENGDGRFEAPDFTSLPVVSGPNTSSSFMIANGKKSSSQSYSYILRPMDEAFLQIPGGAYVENNQKQLIDPLTIVVMSKDKIQSASSAVPGKTATKVNREKRKF